MGVMMISSSRATAQKIKKFTQNPPQTAEPAPSFSDTFAKQAPSEIGRAVGYSALAGLTAATVGHLVSVGTSSLPSALNLGIGLAAGAAFGLLSGLGVSAFKAATQEAPTPPPAAPPRQEPVPPAPPKPEPNPAQVFSQDSKAVASVLSRRVSSLDSLIRAEKIRTESLNRRGQEAFDEAKRLLEQAGSEMPAASQRPEIVALGEARSTAQQQLQNLREQEQRVLSLRMDAESIGRESLGRRGRYAIQQSEKLGKDLKLEAARLTQALQKS